ncbi:MAG: ABC transporter substrate-binding protein [Chloroflexota bacterium]|nr:ABC transporter substrate-binding protein [Chloroflexota bacterium]
MKVIEKVRSFFSGRHARKPVGTVHVVDPSPLNWLYITYNTVEELVRVTPSGLIRPAAMKMYRWLDARTLEIDVRQGNRFPDGELVTAATVKRAFDEAFRWQASHPPGTHFNLDPRTRCEIVGDDRIRLHLPDPDGLALGKLRAYHIMSTAFWTGPGFGYARNGSGEGHW